MVDLENLKIVDIVKFRDRSSLKVQNISVRDSDCTYPYTVTFENEEKVQYTKEGAYFFYGNHDDRDIIEIISQSNAGAPTPDKETPKPADDPVNHPSHYTSGDIECIQAIKASMTKEAYKGFLKGNVLKYLWRYESKGKPAEDLKKAKTYLEWLIKEAEE